MASGIERYLRRVIAADSPSPGAVPTGLRALLGGCAGLYDAGLEAYLAAERLRLRRRDALPIPVVSIGNLTVGGTGKTPMTQWLCRHLIGQGKRIAVLSRGHGGAGQKMRVVSDTEGHVFLSSSDAGDEPILLARTLPGVPVLVGKDRRLSGREAMRRFALDALVLDDGFQYWQLARDLDIVLLDARRPFDNGHPLPRGLLREPMRHLRRAHIAVVTRSGNLDEVDRAALRHRIASLAPDIDVYFADHRAAGLVPMSAAPSLAPPLLGVGGLQRIVALSGIAQPESFAKTLADASGAQIVRHLVYDDHARYSEEEAKDAYNIMRELGADALVMTEKDAVKWPALRDENIPVYALRIEICMEDEARFLEAVQSYLFARRAP